MAATTQGIASFGKRVVKQISSPPCPAAAAVAAAFSLRRAAHTSVYDKNLDDQVRPTVVPDNVIQPETDKYWAPHPQTGVFGPVTEHHSAAGTGSGFPSSTANSSQDSLWEEKAWFRPTSLEDLEKPHHA